MDETSITINLASEQTWLNFQLKQTDVISYSSGNKEEHDFNIQISEAHGSKHNQKSAC